MPEEEKCFLEGVEEISCLVCSRSFKVITNTHLAKHGLTETEYLTRYPNAKLWSEKSRQTVGNAHRGLIGWGKGKTKYDDERIRIKGLKRRGKCTGLQNPMNRPDVRAKWERICSSPDGNFMKTRHIIHKMHRKKVEEEMQKFIRDGFRVIPVGHDFPTPDIVIIKDNKIFAVEVAKDIEPNKYLNFPYYDDIIWIIRRD